MVMFLPNASSHAHTTPWACPQFEWRNGWFYEISEAALAAGKPDPMPLHTAGLKKLGVVS